MFRWMQTLRRRPNLQAVSEPREQERDVGEEELETHKEDAEEAAPDGMTRVKTDNL